MRFLSPRSPLYYGWIITAALAITETISWGIIYYAFSVFISPMETELGWSRGEMTGAFSLSLLVAGAIAFPIGSWIDRHGARWLMTLGSIAASLLVLAWSQVHTFTAFYLIWIGLGVCSAAVLYEPAFAVVTTWFTRRRSQALALVTLAAGLASTIFIPLSDALLHTFGWREALVLLAILLAVVTIPLHALVLRRRPDDLGLLPDGEARSETVAAAPPSAISLRQILRSRTFWLLVAGFSLSNLAADAIRVHFIPFLIDAGINASTAAWASGSIGVMQVLGRILFAPLDTRLSNRVMLAGIFGLQMLILPVLLLGSSAVFLGAFILVFGAVYGARTLARASSLAYRYGASHYGRISSVMAVCLTLARTAAPVGAGLLYDRFGSYQPVLWSTLIISAISFGIALLIRPEPQAV